MSSFSVAFLLLASAAFANCGPVPFPAARTLIPVSQALDTPLPYEFGYEFGDGLGMAQHRREVSDGNGVVRGRYGYVDPLGVYRNVEYTANADGYRAVINSNEPGSVSQQVGNAVFFVQPPPPAVVQQGLRYGPKLIPV